MKKQNTILALMALLTVCLVGLVSAAVTVNLMSPTNNTWRNDGIANFTFNVSGSGLNWDCNLWHNLSQTWGADATLSNGSVDNNSVFYFRKTGIADQTIGRWNVRCEEVGDATTKGFASQNFTAKFDNTDPVVISATSHGVWFKTDTAVNISMNVTDTNAGVCLLHGTFNFSVLANKTRPYAAGIDSKSYTSGTKFTFGALNTSYAWLDNSTTGYRWNYTCNDSAGNSVSLSGLRSLWVDTVAPASLALQNILVGSTGAGWLQSGNNSKATDYTPRFNWTVCTEINFSRYHVQVWNSSGTRIYSANVSGRTTNNHTVTSNLQGDNRLVFNVTAYDLAGNTQTSNLFVYKTDSTCHTLYEGWNLCAYINNAAKNASAICNEVECDYIAKYNKTHAFQIYENGTAVNDEMLFDNTQNWNGSIFIYVGSDRTWDTRIWGTNITYDQFTFTNASGEGWNIVPFLQQDSRTLGQLDFNSTNANPGSDCVMAYNASGPIISEFAIFDPSNSSTPFSGHTGNFTVGTSRDLIVDFGMAIWMYFDFTKIGLSTWNWNSTNKYNATTNCAKW